MRLGIRIIPLYLLGAILLLVSYNNCSGKFSVMQASNGVSSSAATLGSPVNNPVTNTAPAMPMVDVVVANDGIRAASYDGGKNWLYTNDGSFPNDCWGYRGITYGNGVFVGISSTGGYGRITSSPDGIHWRTYESTWQADGITYGGGMFVSDSFTSTDGYNFNFRLLNVDVGNHAVFAYVNGNYIVSGSSNGIAISPDGINFKMTLANYTTPDVLAYFSNMHQFAVGKGIVVGIGPQRVVTSSDGGQTWTNQDNFFGYGSAAPTSALQYNVLDSIIFDGNQFVIYGGSGNYGQTATTWKSVDGINWTMAQVKTPFTIVGGDPNSHLLGFTSSNSFTLANMFISTDLGNSWQNAISLTLSSFYDFSTNANPIQDVAVTNIGTYSVGAIASGLASSDPITTPVLPPSVLLTHAQMLSSACGPNLPAGR